MSYALTAWYWAVGSVAGKVFSSASGAFVDTSDATYTAWLAGPGNAPSPVATVAELYDVLAINPAVLDRAAAALTTQGGLTPIQQVAALQSLGVTLTSTGTASLNGTYAVDDATQAQIAAVYAGIKGGDGLPGGASTFNWSDASGAPHAFTAAQFEAFAKGCRDYLYNLQQYGILLAANQSPAVPSAGITIA